MHSSITLYNNHNRRFESHANVLKLKMSLTISTHNYLMLSYYSTYLTE